MEDKPMDIYSPGGNRKSENPPVVFSTAAGARILEAPSNILTSAFSGVYYGPAVDQSGTTTGSNEAEQFELDPVVASFGIRLSKCQQRKERRLAANPQCTRVAKGIEFNCDPLAAETKRNSSEEVIPSTSGRFLVTEVAPFLRSSTKIPGGPTETLVNETETVSRKACEFGPRTPVGRDKTIAVETAGGPTGKSVNETRSASQSGPRTLTGRGKTSESLLQINLQHSKAATALLCSRLSVQSTKSHIVAIQEPWAWKGRVLGLGGLRGFNILYDERSDLPRTCLIISSSIPATRLDQFCGQDLVAATVNYETNGEWQTFVVASVYFPWNSILPPPTRQAAELVEFCESRKLGLIMCCDANAQNLVWGSTKCNMRGNHLLSFILSSDLDINNVGNTPTFVTARRQEVIDLTLSNRYAKEITNWKVLLDVSLSDHRYIQFHVTNVGFTPAVARNPKKTNWTLFNDELGNHVKTLPKLTTKQKVEDAVLEVNCALTRSFELACPARPLPSRSMVPWWNAELQKLRRETRSLLNRSLKTKSEADWNLYRSKQKDFKRSIRRSKNASYKEFCESIETLSETSRLTKALKRSKVNKLESLRKSNGSYTESKAETLSLMLETHFPGNQASIGSPQSISLRSDEPDKSTRHSWYMSSLVATDEAIKYAVASFDSFKSPGTDGVYPAMLQESINLLLPTLKNIFTGSLALAYIPTPWQSVRVVFIPKIGKQDYSLAKSFRPISLTSFLLKTLERMVEIYIRKTSLQIHPLSQMQHAYQRGKSCETALQNLVSRIECVLDRKDFAVGIFIDIQGAFDNASFDGMCNAAREHGVDESLVLWIKAMLMNRTLIVEAECGKYVTTGVNKGCPQGGVLSPLLWCMLIDSLLVMLNGSNVHAQAYADDVAVLSVGPSLRAVLSRAQAALNMIDTWCARNGLSVNPLKTEVVLFTRRRKLTGLTQLTLKGVSIPFSNEVKHLGVILDNKLLWSKHVESKTSKALSVFWQCRGAFGKTWGLSPKRVLWIYTAMIRPIISYASVVWWNKLSRKYVIASFAKLQRTICLGCTGAFPSTPGAALDALLNLPPLDTYIMGCTLKTISRLKRCGLWHNSHWSFEDLASSISFDSCLMDMPSDTMIPRLRLRQKYSVSFPSVQDWSTPESEPGMNCYRIFTDGSRTEGGSGAGAFVECDDTRLYASLGTYSSVFQAEAYAIQMALSHVTNNGWRGRSICVCSDSQAVLKALLNPLTTSKVIQECKSSLNEVGRLNSLSLIWVPGHHGITGNEIADELARQGSQTAFSGPEPSLGLPGSSVRASINDWIFQEQNRRWHASIGCRQTKRMLPNVNKKTATFLLSRSRKECRKLIGVVTGHFSFAKHLNVLGLSDTTLCESCGEDEDTAEHFLCECPAFSRMRLQILGADMVRAGNLGSLSWQRLLAFLRTSGKL